MDSAIIGMADHNGWAVVVTVAGDGTLLDRRRVELVDADLPKMPHHGPGQRLPLEQAVDLVERVRVSAGRHAERVLDTMAKELSASIRGIAIRRCPELPTTVAERITNCWAQTRADSVMYRMAVAGAAETRGWSVHWYDPKTVLDAARDAGPFTALDDRFREIREAIGPPWQKDHRIAMAAAIVAAAHEGIGRRQSPR